MAPKTWPSSGPITEPSRCSQGLGSLHSLSSLSPAPYCGIALGFWPLLALRSRVRWCWACRRGAGGAACPNCLAVTVACVPRARGTSAPKHRNQGNNPQVHAGTEPILKAPQDVSSGWGVRKWAALGSHPAQSLHVGPLKRAERPPEHCSEALKGPVLAPVTTQAAYWPGELTRTASEVFWHLLPIEFAGRGCEPCADPPTLG